MKFSSINENIVKILVVFAFISNTTAYSQNGFDSKLKKNQVNRQLQKQFELVSPPSKNLRRNYDYRKLHSVSAIKGLKIVKDQESGAIMFIENNQKISSDKNARLNANQISSDFLLAHKNDFGITNPDNELVLVDDSYDENGNKHLRYQQKFNGVNIYGGEIALHLSNQQVKTLNGRLFSTPKELITHPQLSIEDAIAQAYKEVSQHSIVQHNQLRSSVFNTTSDHADLIIYHEDQKPLLAYEVEIRPNVLERWVYFINAINGDIISNYNHTCTLDGVFTAKAKDLNGITQSINITQIGNTYYLIDPTKPMFNAGQSHLPDDPTGAIWTVDAQNSRISDDNMNIDHVKSSNGSNWSPTSVSAHLNAAKCYDYYKNTFGRNSLNGNGGNIISVINITDEDGTGMDNAYWNGAFMGYGNGNKAFKPLAGGLDVAGHEMTHGVIENTARLEYRNQSGALNESLADIFGSLIDRDDWVMGEDIVKTSVFPSGALRSLENPNQGGKRDNGYQPANMGQYEFLRDVPSEDNGGVHINSGIPNHAFYLFATANGMDRSKAEKVYYQAMTKYLTRTSKFVDMRLAVIQAAKDLFGDGTETAAARAAFDGVGIQDPGSSAGGNNNTTPNSQEQQQIPINTGEQNLIVYEPDGQSLYNVPYNYNADYTVLADGYGCLRKPSVTDDGSAMYFVGKDKFIYGVDLTSAKPTPKKLSQNASWDNVAISKNGKLLAALTDAQDATMYVFDLENGKNVRFELYNPTYTSGVQTGEVQYADSFEWDYSGEYIIYDAFNTAGSAFGGFEYWDVGIIRAWNAGQNTFADGEIQKIFTDLKEGDNIGNPAFSKTNPNILAFDYLDSNTDQTFILGLNLSTGDLKVVLENNNIGFPDFTVDDKALSYTAFQNGVGEVIKMVQLNADKISTNSTSGTRIFDSGQDKWGVFYASGSRKLPTKQGQTIQFTAIADKNPNTTVTLSATASSGLPVQYSLISGDASLNGTTLKLGILPGKVSVQAFQIGSNAFASVSAEQTFCAIPSAPTVSLNGQIASASGGINYQWYVNGKALGGVTNNNTQNTSNFSGSYSVKSVTEDGCFSSFSNSVTAEVEVTLSIEAEENLKAYPNPVREKLNIRINKGDELEKVTLFDLSGKVILDGNSMELNVSNLVPGNYLLKTRINSKEYMQKIIKE